MSLKKIKTVKHKITAWPKMRFHPVTGDYVVCADESEVPEGFIDDPKGAEQERPATVGPSKCHNFDVPDKYKDKSAKKAAPKKAAPKKAAAKKAPAKKAAPKKAAEVTLESLDIGREEALELLVEEGIEHAEDVSDEDLAALVADILED